MLIDKDRVGAGASGGLMGAMFPWMPDRWDAKKQFQFDALTTLPDEFARIEAATGLNAGFRRSGRIIPLPKPHLKAIALRHQADALRNWNQGANRFFWQVSEAPPVAGYIAAEFGAGGYVHDTLAARVEPRAVVALLRAWLMMHHNVRIVEATQLVALDAVKGRAEITLSSQSQGRAEGGIPECRTITFSHIFIAAGVESFPILENLLPPLPAPLGQGVKGQAALLEADLDPALPVAFLDGLYIVPHENGHVAVGSTSENSYADPHSTDEQLDLVIEKARALVPMLRDAAVIEHWAGLRPKAVSRDPMVGPVPSHPNVIALTGGFKISFGMAHRLAACALDYALGRAPEDLPKNFTLSGQMNKEFGLSI
jgi:glycine oxidase